MKTIYLAIFSSLVISACSNSASNDYVGKWVNVKSECRTFEIEKNGANFLVKVSEPSMFSRELKIQTVPASLKDEILRLEIPGNVVALSFNKNTGNLVTPKGDYRRPTEKDKACQIPTTAEPIKLPNPEDYRNKP